jgi:Uma2 family endonuclease
MNAPFPKPWTQEQFFAWAGHQEGRWEFDGIRPVAIAGGTINHSLIIQNIHTALHERLRGSGCMSLGPDTGMETSGGAVRYPDALLTCAKLDGGAMTVLGVIAVFEVLAAKTQQTDCILKVREYAAVSSVRRYVILESTSIGLQVLERAHSDKPWIATALTGDDILRMPEIGIEIPVAEFYEDVDFGGGTPTAEVPA